MFQVLAIGNLGGDAIVKGDAGREFVTFRIAHNERFKDSQGVEHNNTQWIDCVMDGRPRVLDWLKAGQLVCVQGSASLRIFDSAKDHCKKAGIQVSVRSLELLGGSNDVVPSRLYDAGGQVIDVQKHYYAGHAGEILTSSRGQKFACDDNGWVFPFEQVPNDVKNEKK